MRRLIPVVIGVLAALSPAVAHAADAFGPGPGSPLPIGAFPESIVTGDFNTDGNQDIATAASDGSVTIEFGNGHGGFTQSGSPIQALPAASAMATGDLNGDGHADLAVLDYNDGEIAILLGNGSGAFAQAPGSPIVLGGAVLAPAIGPFIAADAHDELALVNSGQIVLIGEQPDQSFATLTASFPAVTHAEALAGGYFTNNSDYDLAVLDGGSANVTLLNGDGTGQFTVGAGSPFATGLTSDGCTSQSFCFYTGTSLAAGGFNTDSSEDLAVGSDDGRISVLLGNRTAGTFALAPGSPFPASGGIQVAQLVAENFGGSSAQGIATANYFQGGCPPGCSLPANSVSVLLPNGSGGFTQAPGSPYLDGGVTTAVAATDFNNDALGDVAFGDGDNCRGNGVGVLLGAGPAGATPAPGTYPADGCQIPKPKVTTGAVTDLSLSSATLNGTVDPQYQALTDCHFEYGIGSLSHSVPCTVAPESVAVSAKLTGLQGLRTYEYRLVAASAGGTVTGATQTFQTCQTPIVQFGSIEALGCFTSGANGSWVAHGPVTVNGLQYIPTGSGMVTLEPPARKGLPGTLRATGSGRITVAMQLGLQVGLGDYAGGFTLPLNSSPHSYFTVDKRLAKFLDFPVTANLSGTIVKGTDPSGHPLYGTTLTGSVSLKPIGDDGQASLSVTVYNDLGAQGLSVAVQPANADPNVLPWQTCNSNVKYVGYTCESVNFESGFSGWRLISNEPRVVHLGPLQVTDLVASYDFATKRWKVQAGLGVGTILPGPLSKAFPTFDLGGTFGPDGLEAFHIGDSTLHWTLGPFQISSLSFDITFQPHFGIGGQISANILKDVDFLKKLGFGEGVSVDGGFSYKSGNNSGFDLKIMGPVPLFDLPIKGFVELDTRDGNFAIALGGSFNTQLGPVSLNVGLNGGVQIKPSLHVQLQGNGTAQAFGQTATVQLLLSDAGIGGCGSAQVGPFSVDLGFKHLWQWDISDWQFQGCDFSGLYTVGAGSARDATAGRTVRVARGTRREEFAAVGAGAAPDVVLTGPHGERLSTPKTVDRLEAAGAGVALADSNAHTTYFIVEHPAAGRWTLSPAPGAAPPLRLKLAAPLEPLQLRTRVSGHGRSRTLDWHLRAQRGQTVQFIQTGGRRQSILTTSRGSGRARFTVAPGPGGRRTVIAIVSIDGTPRKQLAAAHFSAPQPIGPLVTRARYSVKRGVLRASWRRARGAVRYEVAIKLGQGRSVYELKATASRITVRLGPGSRVREVAITAYGASGVSGRPVTARNR